MEFLKVFDQTWEVISTPCGKIAEETSLCSDNPQEIWCSGEFLTDANHALALLAVLPLVCPSTRNYSCQQSIREHVARIADNYKLEGNWSIVGRILSTTSGLQVYDCWTIIQETMTTNEWFGNFVPLLVQAFRAVRWRKVYRFVTEDHRPVRKPQRKRGYSDKGSQRPSHKWIPVNAYAREDILKPTKVKEPRSFAWFKYCE